MKTGTKLRTPVRVMLSVLLTLLIGVSVLFMHTASFMGIGDDAASELWYLCLEVIGFALLQYGLLYLNYRLRLSDAVPLIISLLYMVPLIPKVTFAIRESSWLCGLCAAFDLTGILICFMIHKKWPKPEV